MRDHYDFSKMHGVRNPYIKKLRKQISINVDIDTIDFFKKQSAEVGIPYQTLINMYLADCSQKQKKLKIAWS